MTRLLRWLRLLGVQKCGTTSLHEFLSHAPTLCSAPKKERALLNKVQPEEGLMYSSTVLERYLKGFLNAAKCKRLNKGLRHLTLDSTPNYINSQKYMELLKAISPHIVWARCALWFF